MLKKSASVVLASLSILNVAPEAYASGRFISAAALLDDLFEHPAGMFSCCATRADNQSSRVPT